MKTTDDNINIRNGWLIPSKKCTYSNTPLIKVNMISSMSYYTGDKPLIRFFLISGREYLDWEYPVATDMIDDYQYISDNYLFIDNVYGKFESKNILLIKG